MPARDNPRVIGAVSVDGTGQVLLASPVRKERVKKSKKELEEEAARVLRQADNLDCVVSGEDLPNKFYTLPNRKKHKEYPTGSLDRRPHRRGSLDLLPPKKPPRTFANSPPPQSQKSSIFDVFKKSDRPKKSNLRRSVSDATNLKSKEAIKLRKSNGSDTEQHSKTLNNKKTQLSPIIEVTQQEDYFSPKRTDNSENDKENIEFDNKAPPRKKNKATKTQTESITDQLKQYIDEVDEELYKETGIRISANKETKEIIKPPEPIIIDVDKAEKITGGKKSKFKSSSIGKKIKSITNKKIKANEANKTKVLQQTQTKIKRKPTEQTKPIEIPKTAKQSVDESQFSISPNIKAAINDLASPKHSSPKMIHSSQKPTEKPALTKGRTVDHIVKRLSTDSGSPPPLRSNILIAPNVSVQHNNNQPFSYTRGLSPDKYVISSNENLPPPQSPIIYAQVVCGNNGTPKQTVHTAYNGKKQPHSDSDEGLGGEENGFGKKYDRRNISKSYSNYRNNGVLEDYFDEVDKYKEESPILPKFRNTTYNSNGFYENKNDYTEFVERGRGDGMDSKRRESLTEPHENDFNNTTTLINGGRTDLSARRDLLESRINRRINDKSIRTSPQSPTNVYISESSSKYYRSGSTSPVGYKEKYVAETKTDKHGEKYVVESRTKKYFGEPNDRLKINGYTYNGFDSEPKSLDSQISDYRSSPEHAVNSQQQSSQNRNRYNSSRTEQKILFKDRNMYKSTPEIHHSHHYLDNQYHNNSNSNAYHDSLRREKTDTRMLSTNKYKSERYLLDANDERKDKFGDSGIENDFGRRDSSENYRSSRHHNNATRREYFNDSEDEGFASSLLIASERQHTEDNLNNRSIRKEYDSDRTNSREDDPYRHLESMNMTKKYSARERSIDDGSHYDPRLDKDVDRSTLKSVERKPPKPEKKSGLEKVKSLFIRDNKKKKEKPGLVREESLRARYIEYKGRDSVEPKIKKKEVKNVNPSYDYGNRRRLSTPSPSPPRQLQRSGVKSTLSSTPSSWFKSLDRLSRKKSDRQLDREAATFTSTEDEQTTPSKRTPTTKNLRFFGDTDAESGADSVRHKTKMRPGVNERTRSQSTRDLHNISEEESLHHIRKVNKSMTNINNCESDRDIKGSRTSLKPPISPSHRRPRDASMQSREDIRARRRKNEVSSIESSTEGDSSQQSQRSVVYLHAATVGDIPGPGYLRNGRRSASREELASNSSSRIQPQVKTLSRSFSVLAPWRPRHQREAMDIDYTQHPKKNSKYEQKSESNSNRKQSSTLKKKAQETRKNNSSSSATLNRRSRSKESLSYSQNNGHSLLRKSREELSKGSNSTLFKKKENRLPRESSRYSNNQEKANKVSSKSLSVESLGHKANRDNGRDDKLRDRDISRSVSMPRDPEKSAGWFKLNKKPKFSSSAQRL